MFKGWRLVSARPLSSLLPSLPLSLLPPGPVHFCSWRQVPPAPSFLLAPLGRHVGPVVGVPVPLAPAGLVCFPVLPTAAGIVEADHVRPLVGFHGQCVGAGVGSVGALVVVVSLL